MNEPVVYDKAQKHYQSDNYPCDLTVKQADVHTGMYLGWIIEKGLYSESFGRRLSEIRAFRERRKTGAAIYALCDSILTSDMLNDQGNRFTASYFSRYMLDYKGTLAANAPSLYHVSDSWENYDKLARLLDKRYNEWQGIKPKKKWWQFWL
jgi:hypothetical protein